jgi:predicted glycosyltransferase
VAKIAMSAPRVFIYVQHLLGIGHLVRANRIALALVDDSFDVAMATGGLPVPGFPGPGIRTIALPAVKAGSGGFSALEDENGVPVNDAFKQIRRDGLIAALQYFKPDAVIVETFPFGRRAMRFELLPFLDAVLSLTRRPLIACSVRDILQQHHKPGRAEETLGTIDRYFDKVLVHGDPKLAIFGETFPLANSLENKILYTGLVAGPHPAPPAEHYDIVISAGGGAVGRELVTAAAQMSRQLDKRLRCCLITGPNLPPNKLVSLKAEAGPNIEIFSFREDFPSLLVGAQLSISQAGYNTVCDILRAGCRSVLIPFAKDGETEQTLRALRLKKLGLAHVLSEDELNTSTLTRAVQNAIGEPAPRPHGFNLEGAKQTAALIRSLM